MDRPCSNDTLFVRGEINTLLFTCAPLTAMQILFSLSHLKRAEVSQKEEVHLSTFFTGLVMRTGLFLHPLCCTKEKDFISAVQWSKLTTDVSQYSTDKSKRMNTEKEENTVNPLTMNT